MIRTRLHVNFINSSWMWSIKTNSKFSCYLIAVMLVGTNSGQVDLQHTNDPNQKISPFMPPELSLAAGILQWKQKCVTRADFQAKFKGPRPLASEIEICYPSTHPSPFWKKIKTHLSFESISGDWMQAIKYGVYSTCCTFLGM